ncbi:uncharacterized protein [Nicotiana sylvestris]|uniref:uncharacterized protein n=1 Tax=Nicotiana sylvestris TaxID=4096 RepID=UPI00388C4EA0
MKDDESIQDMHTRFTSIINELHSLGDVIPRNKLVRKILSILPSSWESKVNAITKAKDLKELTIDELVGNLKTYEMKRKIDSERREPKKEKNPVLKAERNDSSEEDSDMTYLTKRFQKMVRRNGGILKKGNSSKPKNYDLCHKCRKPGHFIKDCPLIKQEHSKYNPDKEAKRNLVLDKHFKRKRSADNVVKQALVAWGDSSGESEEETDVGDSSMMAVESEGNEYDSIFALMAQSDDDEEDDNDEVNFRDVQRNLKSYSPKKLMSLANVLIDAYHSLVEDKDALTLELVEAEQTRDDLVVCVVDLKETINDLENEKIVLTEKIASIEHERDDLVVVAVEYKETIENFNKEKEALVKRVTTIEEDRDDLLIVIADLRETMEEPRLSVGLEILKKEKRQGIGFQRERTPYNPHSKYVTGKVKGSSQQWFMDSGCSKHMTGNTMDFLSLKALQGGSVSFDNGKKGYILGIGKVGKSLTHSIENVYYVNGVFLRLIKETRWSSCPRYAQLQICGDLSYLKAVDDDAELWHRRLGYTSFSLLNKLIQKDLVRGLPMSKFKEHKVCDACARGKHVKSSFKSKKDVSTSKPLDLLHMDLYGPTRVQSRGGKRHIFVIMDDYSRFTWTLFFRTKDETFEVSVAL